MSEAAGQEQEFEELCRVLSRLWNLDLSAYNRTQLQRRMAGLLGRVGVRTAEELQARLRSDPQASAELRDHFTINVTQFFRDGPLFERLESLLRGEGFHQRCGLIWSAACSTGMEPYSVAMIMDSLAPSGTWRIAATDIDGRALEAARAAVYTEGEIKTVPATWRQRYFREAEGGKWQVSERLRKRVSFSELDLLNARGRQPRGCDLVLCRNVIIYFGAEGKARVFQTLAQSLRPGGLLFLGATERISEETAGEFTCLQPFFYVKKAA